MRSRYLQQLDQRMVAAGGGVEAACLRAQRAIYLARQGKGEAATAIVAGLREEFRARPNAELTAWISLAESLIDFYAVPGPQAIDRLRRAQALAGAIRHPVLVPLCAAWLAHMEFNAGRAQQTVEHAAQALRLAQPDHHAALARVSLVVADALHFAGNFDLARPWYAAVREHALAEGDDAMISAMLHNVATLRANQVRLDDSFGRLNAPEMKRALLEVDSVETYDVGVGAASLPTLVPLVRAQLQTALGNFQAALDLYRQALDSDGTLNLQRRMSCFYAERAWCHFRLGLTVPAEADADRALANAGLSCDADDLATTFARVAAIFEGLGDSSKASTYRQISRQHEAVHSRAQHHWLQLLSSLQSAHPAGH